MLNIYALILRRITDIDAPANYQRNTDFIDKITVDVFILSLNPKSEREVMKNKIGDFVTRALKKSK